MAQAEAQDSVRSNHRVELAPAHLLADQQRLAENAARPIEHHQVRRGAAKSAARNSS